MEGRCHKSAPARTGVELACRWVCSLAPRFHLIDSKCSICTHIPCRAHLRFEANDAFRTGMEATLTRTRDRHVGSGGVSAWPGFAHQAGVAVYSTITASDFMGRPDWQGQRVESDSQSHSPGDPYSTQRIVHTALLADLFESNHANGDLVALRAQRPEHGVAWSHQRHSALEPCGSGSMGRITFQRFAEAKPKSTLK